MLEIGDIENDIDVSLSIRAAHLHIPDVGFSVADHSCNLFQHAKTVVAKDRKLHRIRTRCTLIAGPFHVDTAFRLVQQIDHVGTIYGMDGDALAAGDVTNHVFATDGVAAAGAIHQQIAMAFHADGIVAAVSAEDPPDHAGNSARLFTLGDWRGRGWRQSSQDLARGILAVSDSGHQVVNLPQAVVGGDFAQFFVFEFFQRDAVLACFFFDQLASDFDGALALMNIEPVFDLIAGAGRLDRSQPITARLVPWLRNDFDDVPTVQFVPQRHHAPVHLGTHATVANFGVNGVSEIDR